jgi:serine/threonine protein kinase
VTGTPEFMAPEQARGRGEAIDHRADQFSLAAVAYALLTGREPFKGPDPAALLYQVIHETPLPPSCLAPRLGPGVDAVIGRAMSKRAADRYPGVMAFSDALQGALGGAVIGPYIDRAQTPRSSVAELPLLSAGRDTRRFIRKAHRRIRNRRSGPVLLALAAAAAFAWFSPPTRDTTRAFWHRAGREARQVVRAASTSRAAASLATAASR